MTVHQPHPDTTDARVFGELEKIDEISSREHTVPVRFDASAVAHVHVHSTPGGCMVDVTQPFCLEVEQGNWLTAVAERHPSGHPRHLLTFIRPDAKAVTRFDTDLAVHTEADGRLRWNPGPGWVARNVVVEGNRSPLTSDRFRVFRVSRSPRGTFSLVEWDDIRTVLRDRERTIPFHHFSRAYRLRGDRDTYVLQADAFLVHQWSLKATPHPPERAQKVWEAIHDAFAHLSSQIGYETHHG